MADELIIYIPLCVIRQHRAGICSSINVDFNLETQFTK